jgi:hypothetical protein
MLNPVLQFRPGSASAKTKPQASPSFAIDTEAVISYAPARKKGPVSKPNYL